MHVVATAGHVDHGKSTLVRALTGMEPDRWAEEQRRGMTIDLGYAWTTLPTGETLAFVDVPGHSRFVANMLAGVGPAPAVLFVVAADQGWSRQSTEHLEALHALGVRRGVLAVTRSDLADPSAAQGESLARIARTSLGSVSSVAVSAVTGSGIDQLREMLRKLAATMPAPEATDRVRVWIDRSFSIRGAGTVLTSTLQSGAVSVGQRLVTSRGGEVRIRGLHSLGQPHSEITAVARIAVNAAGGGAGEVGRGDALLTPGGWRCVSDVDVRLTGAAAAELPRQLLLHVGTAAVAVHVRPLGNDTARLLLQRPLPLQNGDRGALRDPGEQRIAAGMIVLDSAPAALTRRGAATARGQALQAVHAPDGAAEVRRRGCVQRGQLREMGCALPPPSDLVRHVGDWCVSADQWAAWSAALVDAVDAEHRVRPLSPGLPINAAAHAIGVPGRSLAVALIAACAELESNNGVVRRAGRQPTLPDAVARLLGRLAAEPYDAPTAAELRDAGLTPQVLAAAANSQLLVRLRDDVVLTPDAVTKSVQVLAEISEPFELAQVRTALSTSRRVAVALMEHLDASGVTIRGDRGRRLRR